MKCGHLFNGIGGFPLAAHWMGWENIMHCEIDSFCNKIMNKHFHNSIGHGDIKTTDFTIYRGIIDLLSGGDPCQPSSRAGKRKGKEDDRYLWPEYKRCIAEIRPRIIINENVLGTIENGILDEKINDLEALGYSWWPPIIVPASSIGANHRRERVWLVAYSNCNGIQRCRVSIDIKENRQRRESSKANLFHQREFAYGYSSESESELIRADDGIPDWLHRVKALGNAISPQVAYELFKLIDRFIYEYDFTSNY